MAEEATNFSEARERLDEIVKQVRSKDVSLEKSLDLFDEAIKVGNNCFELIDQADFSAEELGADQPSATVDQQEASPESSNESEGDNTSEGSDSVHADEPSGAED